MSPVVPDRSAGTFAAFETLTHGNVRNCTTWREIHMAQANFYDIIGFAPRNTEPRAGAPEVPDLGRALFFIDFDGTLVDIAERPDAVTVPGEVLDLLSDLHARTDGATAVISGRRMEDLERFLPGFPGAVVGSHGAEVKDGATLWRHPAAGSEALICIRRMAETWAEMNPGVLVEEKPCSVALHFRQAPDRMGDGEALLDAVVRQNPGFMLHHAKMALEVHPDDVSKRAAVGRLMRRWPRRLPVAFGDDRTDEGMFEAVNAAGGHSIKVGPGETAADWRLEGPGEVRAALARWLAPDTAGAA
jgi:trehalose 6-phosphate phosphatase